jgi:hypothetical protein
LTCFKTEVFRTNLAAALTHVGLFASVDARMDGESGPLDELLAAAWVVANVRAYSTVDAFWKKLSARTA